MAIIKLSSAERRRASVFFTCLVLSVVAWIIVTLSKPNQFAVKQVLAFENVPQKRAFHSLQSDTVTINEEANGWQMLLSKIRPVNQVVKVDLSALDKENYVILGSQLAEINDRKEIANKILSFSPDTLFFDFSNRSTKRVRVQLSASLKYQEQFAQSDNVIIKPSYITVTGPSSSIDKINVWKTDSLTLNGLSETVNSRVNLEAAKEGNISIYPKSVAVTIPVNEFTEKTIEVPVKLVNNYNYYNVKVFPQKVKVTFTTSLNKYADIDEDLFEANADLDMWKKHNYSSLPVMLTKLPEFCKVVKIEPKNIDFIIKK